MPRGDGTGPAGMGPMTGRAAGYCAGYSTPGFANPYGGRYPGGGGRGMGRAAFGGRGRGNRNWYYATGQPGWYRYNMGYPAWGAVPPAAAPQEPVNMDANEEVDILKGQSEYLKEQLDAVTQRMQELEKEMGKSKDKAK